MQSTNVNGVENEKPVSVKHHLNIKRWCAHITQKYEEIALEEIVKYQRTKAISEGFGVYLNKVFEPPIRKLLRKYDIPEENWEDLYHDLICLLPPVFESFRLSDNRPASVHIIMGGYYLLLSNLKRYFSTGGDTLKEDFPDQREEITWNLDDTLNLVEDYDWAFPPAVCKFCSMMILTGQKKTLPHALRRSICNQDTTQVQHIINHVTVNLRLMLAHASRMWDLEGAIEQSIRGFEETEADINSLRILDSLRGS